VFDGFVRLDDARARDGGVAIAGSDKSETPITGAALDRASAAALAYVGGGTVTGT
jgi:hypothetical protein